MFKLGHFSYACSPGVSNYIRYIWHLFADIIQTRDTNLWLIVELAQMSINFGTGAHKFLQICNGSEFTIEFLSLWGTSRRNTSVVQQYTGGGGSLVASAEGPTALPSTAICMIQNLI